MTEREKLERKHAGDLTKLANGASYITFTENYRPVAIMFRPKSRKPWRKLKFENEKQRDDKVSQFVSQMNSEFYEKRNRREERKASVREFRESVEVGDLFAYAWGGMKRYVSFYQVRETNKSSAMLVKIGAKEVLGAGGAGKCVVPDPDIPLPGPSVTKKYGPGYFPMPEGKLERTTHTTKHFISK